MATTELVQVVLEVYNCLWKFPTITFTSKNINLKPRLPTAQ